RRVMNSVQNDHTVFAPGISGTQVIDADVSFLSRPASSDDQHAVRKKGHGIGSLSAGVDPLFQLGLSDIPDGQLILAADDELFIVRHEGQGGNGDGKLVARGRRRWLPADAQLT